MSVYNVPGNLVSHVDKINIILYENKQTGEKNKVLFSQNVISFVIAGEKEIFLPAAGVTIRNGLALIGLANCLMSERKPANNQSYKALLIFFDNDFLAEFIVKYGDLIEMKKTENQSVGVVAYDVYLKLYRDFILKTIASSTDILSQRMKKLKVEELLLYLLQHYPTEFRAFLNKNFDVNEIQFKAIIEHNRLKNLRIDEVAFLCHMSISTFKRHFKKYYATSPQQWFLQERMHHAKLLLEQGKRPSEIYRQAGYSTLSNFLKAYKKFFGTLNQI